jgi:hypothetical protein
MITRRQTLVGMAAAGIVSPFGQALANNPTRLFFYQLYSEGTKLSDLALQLDGKEVEIVGFMAPPLKAESPFFVLTNKPMETCPFCDEIAVWPDNIIYVTSDRPLQTVPFDRQIRVAGMLDLGPQTDPATGFVSLVRLKHAVVSRA